MKATDFYDESKQRNEDLKILTNVIQAVHKSSNLDEIYSVALDSVTELGNVDMAMVYLVDEERREAVLQAQRNIPEDYIRRAGRIPYPKGVTWKVINTGKILNIEDAQKDPDIGPAGRDLGHHGLLGIPVTLDEMVIGVIWFISYKERKFDEKEVNLLSNLGIQIAIAIAKAKTLEKLERQAEVLSKSISQLSKKNRYEKVISTVTQSVHSSINLNDVMENAVESVKKNMDAAEHIGIYLIEGEDAVLKAHRIDYADWFVERIRKIPYPKGFIWKTIIEGKSISCDDTDKDTAIGPAGREVGIKSYMSIPIRFEEKIIGAIGITSLKKNALEEEELKLLEIVAGQIEIAISNAKQAESVRESEERYRTLIEHTYDLICETSPDGKYLYVSSKYKDLLGYEPGKLIGRSVFEHIHPDDRSTVMTEFQRAVTTSSTGHAVFRYRHNNGKWCWLESTGKPFKTATGEIRGVIASRDITERKLAEVQLKASLKEKEVLLREIHHRVKNNLQLISSLLNLQSGYIKDERTHQMFNVIQNRIKSMALIHQQLYQSKNLSKIEFAEYIRSLGNHLFHSYGINSDSISLKINVDAIPLDIDTAVPCGLIINELVSNSLKHAFSKGRKGKIQIGLSSDNNKNFTLIVSDNGTGFPKDLDFRNTKSLGLQLVMDLVEQLEGNIELSRNRGTTFKVTFTKTKEGVDHFDNPTTVTSPIEKSYQGLGI